MRPGAQPKRLSLDLWMHLSVDALWVANGALYVVLLFVTGQWMRIIPTSWEFIPNTISAALQYVSMDWPTEDGWVNYNSLQVLAYFVTVFIAGPLAFITGLRMSPLWPGNERLGSRLPDRVGTQGALPGHALLRALRHRARDARARHWRCAQPGSHVRRE